MRWAAAALLALLAYCFGDSAPLAEGAPQLPLCAFLQNPHWRATPPLPLASSAPPMAWLLAGVLLAAISAASCATTAAAVLTATQFSYAAAASLSPCAAGTYSFSGSFSSCWPDRLAGTACLLAGAGYLVDPTGTYILSLQADVVF